MKKWIIFDRLLFRIRSNTLVDQKFIFGLSLVFASTCFAQMEPLPKPLLNPQLLESLQPSPWQGVVLHCNPYCSQTAIKIDGKWEIQGGLKDVNPKNLRFISTSDPLYPLLVTNPHLGITKDGLSSNEKSKKDSSKEGHSSTKDEEVPNYAVMSFGVGWTLDLGYQVRTLSLTTNNSLQSELGTGLELNSPVVKFGLMKGKAHKLFGYWVQHAFWMNLGTSGSTDAQDGEPLNLKTSNMIYQMWAVFPRFKSGPRISQYNEQLTVENDSLVHFGLSSNNKLLGWSVLYGRWNATVETVIQGEIADSTSFRSEPIDRKWYRVGLEYCTKDTSFFDLGFGGCAEISFSSDSQKSKLASNLVFGDNSEIEFTTIYAKIAIRFGDDFYK